MAYFPQPLNRQESDALAQSIHDFIENNGFGLLELSEIVSFTTMNNLRSRSVMKKLGMQEDRLTFEHPSLPIGHALREHCLYRLQRNQWSKTI